MAKVTRSIIIGVYTEGYLLEVFADVGKVGMRLCVIGIQNALRFYNLNRERGEGAKMRVRLCKEKHMHVNQGII